MQVNTHRYLTHLKDTRHGCHVMFILHDLHLFHFWFILPLAVITCLPFWHHVLLRLNPSQTNKHYCTWQQVNQIDLCYILCLSRKSEGMKKVEAGHQLGSIIWVFFSALSQLMGSKEGHLTSKTNLYNLDMHHLYSAAMQYDTKQKIYGVLKSWMTVSLIYHTKPET